MNKITDLFQVVYNMPSEKIQLVNNNLPQQHKYCLNDLTNQHLAENQTLQVHLNEMEEKVALYYLLFQAQPYFFTLFFIIYSSN